MVFKKSLHSCALHESSLSIGWVNAPVIYRIMAGIVLASRVYKNHSDTQTIKNHPSGHPKTFVRISENANFKGIIEYLLHQYNPNGIVYHYMYIVLKYFIKSTCVYGWNLVYIVVSTFLAPSV